MGGKLLSILFLLLLVGTVHADIPTTLTVSGPPPTSYTNHSVTDFIICAYYNFTIKDKSVAVPDSNITFYLNGVAEPPTLIYPTYVCYSGVLGIGAYTLYVTASKLGFQSQTSPTQAFVVKPDPTTLTVSGTSSTIYTKSVTNFIICAYYNDTYGGRNFAVPGSTITFYLNGVGSGGNLIYSDHVCLSGIVGIGTYNWYVTASAPSYEPQKSSTQTFYVKPATTLMQYASPLSAAYSGTSITFSASYTDANGPVTGAMVFLYLDGILKNTAYVNGNYTYSTSSLPVGTHQWYFIAQKTDYQPQTGSTQSYTIMPPSGGGGGSGRHLMV
jgi:hypothetical protein